MESAHHRWLKRLCLALLCCRLVFAADLTSLKPQGYVNDFANVLDQSSRAAIERYCGDVEQATGAQMSVVTVETLDAQPIEDAANKLYRQWGIGKKGKDEGVLLMLATRDHKSRVEVGYGLEPVLTDGFVGSVLREIRPSLQQGNFPAAIQAAVSELGQKIADSKGVAIQRSMPRRAAPQQRGGGIPGPLIFLGIILLFWLIGRGGGGGGLLTGLLLGNLLGGRGGFGGGSGWGGGGFGGGGGGSGGGFGGFGGGDSGGGGASGSW